MSLFTIDQEKCKQDGICVEECPQGLISMGKGEFPVPIGGAQELCLNCGHCVAVCPHGALALKNMRPEDCLMVNREVLPDAESVRQLMWSRRSVRRFRNRPVDRELLIRIIATAQYAPTGGHKQEVYWMVVEKSTQVRDISSRVIEWMRQIPGQTNDLKYAERMQRLAEAWDQGVDRISRGAPHLIIAHYPEDTPAAYTDCVIALSYLELAAYSAGLGACWAGYISNAANAYPPLLDVLGLPNGHRCAGALLVGYARYPYHRIPLRKPPDIIWR